MASPMANGQLSNTIPSDYFYISIGSTSMSTKILGFDEDDIKYSNINPRHV